MAIPGETQHFHGTNGEDTTAQLLGRRFWYLRRSVDIEGADFLVQLRVDSFDEIDSRKADIFVLGIVQSKFLQLGTTAYIKRNYCTESDGSPVEQFFLMCHMQDEQEQTHTYFFSAADILNKLPYDEAKESYCFYLGVNDQYADRKDLPPKTILDSIQEGILKAKEEKSNQYINRLFFYTRDAGRNYGSRYFYLLRRIEGIAVCLAENAETGSKGLLEPRRDIFGNFGGYEWGYAGTGPQFLAWCILSHLKDSEAPSTSEVFQLVHWLIEWLPMEEEWDIPPELIKAILGGFIPTISDTRRICNKSTSHEDRLKVLSRDNLKMERDCP